MDLPRLKMFLDWSLMVEKVDVDLVGRIVRCYIRKFPAPSDLDAGKLSFGFLAGAGFEPATYGS